VIDKGALKLPFLSWLHIIKYYFKMNNIVELNGLQGVKSEKVYAYFSTEPKEVQNALELGIACTGADDNGAYNIYFDDEENICCEYMQRCVTKEFKKVETIEEAVLWMEGYFR
jgi:hypothetical protein